MNTMKRFLALASALVLSGCFVDTSVGVRSGYDYPTRYEYPRRVESHGGWYQVCPRKYEPVRYRGRIVCVRDKDQRRWRNRD